ALFLAADRLLGAFLRAGLDRYYGLDEPAAVLCVGHSHMVLGIDKVALEKTLGVPVAKFAVEGANTADRLEMIRYYFRRHPKSVRAVVYAVDAHTFTSAGLSSASYRLLFPFIDDPGIRAYVKRNCGSRTEYWLRVLLCAPRYNELTITLSFRGILHKWTNFKFGQVNAERLAAQVREGRFRRIGFDPDNLRLFDDTANFVGSHEATFCLAYIPTIDIFNQAEPDKFSRSMDLLRSYAATNSSVRFLDYNREIQGRHELFYDPIHLNRPGQKVVTERLAEDLRAFLTKTTANSRTIQRK
ncbi:MAG: hypothetical protein NT031_05215, partial [Planctomycetota bacterium]|nr:hypothetical protein [Planctomycetota bacterium]